MAHIGTSGHRGCYGLSNISFHMFFGTMETDVCTFIRSSLDCEVTYRGVMIPLPLKEAIHADTPNEVLHFDFLYIGKCLNQFIYILVLKDDFSSFYELIPCCSADSFETIVALLSWLMHFGYPSVFVSDIGSNFNKCTSRVWPPK
jgi:hypothetical protein